MRPREIRVESYGFSAAGDRLVEPAQLFESHAQIAISTGEIGAELDRGLVTSDGRLELAGELEQKSQVVESLREVGLAVGGPARGSRWPRAISLACGAKHQVPMGFGQVGFDAMTLRSQAIASSSRPCRSNVTARFL